ncbi:MAG TPA: crossover junction endodeoxyribonuclease RuvC [Candidatus Saccharimonadales bacterium]|nr:crossover junction endodeoxyribonuclease RuvC [Candidatus Saccharimonadales bacterium]
MIVLGIDPGTAACGYGLVEQAAGRLRLIDYGCFTTSPQRSLPERLELIHSLLSDLIVLHSPDVMGVERLFFSRNAQTAFAVGQARGVVLLAAAQHRLPVREGTPNEVKLAIAGDGAADKVAVQRMVQLVLSLPAPPAPDDAADALAVAIWAFNQAPVAAGAILDRAAVAPMSTGRSPYEHAVREALARDRRASRG